jgi:hypothetical protein
MNTNDEVELRKRSPGESTHAGGSMGEAHLLARG